MRRRPREVFPTVQTEGAILPADLLQRISQDDTELPGLSPESYHLAPGERLNELVARSWNRLVGTWAAFQDARTRLASGDRGTTLTRERWLLPLFHELGYGRLLPAKAIDLNGKPYPISHAWGGVPIHLLGCEVSLDHRTPGVAGAAAQSPHSLVQELLNRSDERLYGLLTNGLVLRLLRDNTALTRQAYVEFDLQAMLEGEVYADFALMWTVCHQSRVEGEPPEACWLERWSQLAAEQGTRALETLRAGVQSAVATLGSGFLAQPANRAMRDALRTGQLTTNDYYRELLRLVYRLLFLFTAEDRELLLDPTAEPAARDRYQRWYATSRLRRLAGRRRGTGHTDLWQALKVVMRSLDADHGCPDLALPALGSFLWSPWALPHLEAAELANADLLQAVRALSFVQERGVRRPVDYKNLGSEELGSVYESLLELHPKVHADAAAFELATANGHQRRTSGSYYTPPLLVRALLDSALDPILDQAVKAPDPEAAILSLKVCDPAAGSGHFLIAAAHRIARRLAAARTGELDPAPAELRRALRDVVGHCLFAVDVNEMAVELCKVALWMEALEPGKPLSFLDAHVKCGNSLLGVTPKLLAAGLPDVAFDPLAGDDRTVAKALKQRNRHEREQAERGTVQLALGTDWQQEVARLAAALAADADRLEDLRDDSAASLRTKERAFQVLQGSEPYQRAKLTANGWCAAFFQPRTKDDEQVTHDTLRRLAEAPQTAPRDARLLVQRLTDAHKFFHWHVEFPQVFSVPQVDGAEHPDCGWSGGFDVVLGNPPWERVKLQDKEFFAAHGREDIANARNKAERRRLIQQLADDPDERRLLYAKYQAALRAADAESHFLRHSGRFPLCGRGDVNTYAVFAEAKRSLLAPRGRQGCVIPSAIATDDTTKHFFADLVEKRSLVSLFDFRNQDRYFRDVGHRRFKFCLLTVIGTAGSSEDARFVFAAEDPADIYDPERRFTLSAEDFALLNPNTGTCPVFRSARDAELAKAIYRRVRVLVARGQPDQNPWGIRFATMFHMANDSGLFRSAAECEAAGGILNGNVYRAADGRAWLPLYEAKMVHHFTYRWGDYAMRPTGSLDSQLPDISDEQLADPTYVVQPRYWVAAAHVDERLNGWDHSWLLGFRDITNATNERTVIPATMPRVGVGHSLSLIVPDREHHRVAFLAASLASFALDYCARLKVGGTHLSFFIAEQLPVLPPETYDQPAPWSPTITLAEWLRPKVLELTYTAWDLKGFARDLGHHGPPFPWDSERRFQLRCELDAAFFHLYGISREEAAYILDTFPIVRAHDERDYGEYRTKRLILAIYDALTQASVSGQAYQSSLEPLPSGVQVADALRPPASITRLRRIEEPAEVDKYRTVVPLMTLQAAAGAFGDTQAVDADAWVEVPDSTLAPGMFVARVIGRSMEPRIPTGSWCVFRAPVTGSRQGKIVLAQHHDVSDPEMGGSYTVKRYHSTQRETPDGTWGHVQVTLEPLNPDFEPIVLRDVHEDAVQVIAELAKVFSPEALQAS